MASQGCALCLQETMRVIRSPEELDAFWRQVRQAYSRESISSTIFPAAGTSNVGRAGPPVCAARSAADVCNE
eukprot:10148176-Lingulodinium_polyedra.AAC.1